MTKQIHHWSIIWGFGLGSGRSCKAQRSTDTKTPISIFGGKYIFIHYAVIGTALIFMLLAAAAKARGRKTGFGRSIGFRFIFGAGHYRHYLFPDAAAAFCLSP